MKDLIERAKKGDKMAISDLYSCTYKELLYYCYRLCKNDHDAEDLVQDTYLTALEKLEQYRIDENFKGWLHTIALHKFYNKRRSERPEIWTEDIINSIPAEGELSCPEEYAENRELYRLLSGIIADQLTEPQRLTVIMFYYDEMSIARIAELLECSQGTVKSRLYYARKLIRQELEKNGYVLSGSMLAIPSAFGFESAGFISETALNSKLLADLLGTKSIAKKVAANSVKNFAKGKIIAGATAVAVAGGAAAYHYIVNRDHTAKPEAEPPQIADTMPTTTSTTTTETRSPSSETETQPLTGISVPGGAPVPYDFVVSYFSANIPENFQITSTVFGRNEVKKQEDGKIITLLTPTPQRPFVLRPDQFSGDVIIFARSPSDEVFADLETALSKYFSDVEIDKSTEITLTVDNTHAPEQPTEITAEKTTFSALSSGHTAMGTVVVCKHRVNNYLFVFADCSGIRQAEYDAIIDSVCFRYPDNSWMEDYPHFNSGT